MPALTIDLSGQGGLAPKSGGDLNDGSSQPQLRYIGNPGQVADGIFDPMRVFGYMSPANNTFTALTGTVTDTIVAGTYSSTADTVYLAQNGVNMSFISGLNGTSITSSAILSESSVFKDTELYSVNDQEAIFFTYLNDTPTVSDVANVNLGFRSTDLSKGMFQLSFSVFGSLLETNWADNTINSNPGSYQKFSVAFFTANFVTGNYSDISGVRLRLKMPYVGQAQTWTLKVGIQTDSGGNPSGTYVTNASATIDPNTLPQGVYDYVYVTFTQRVTLTAATEYHLVVEPTNYADIGSLEGVIWLSSRNGSFGLAAYRKEYMQIYDGSSWSAVPNIGDAVDMFDYALILNQYTHVGSSEPTTFIRPGPTQTAGTTGTSLTFTAYLDSLDNTIFILGFHVNSATDIVTSVKFSGADMTLVGKQQGFAASRWEYLYRIQPSVFGSSAPPQAYQVVISLSGSATISAQSAFYYGVDQTSPATQEGSGNAAASTSLAVDVNASIANEFAIMLVTHESGDPVAGTGDVKRAGSATDTKTALFDSGTTLTAGTHTLNFTSSSNSKWMYNWIVLRPATISSLPAIPAITEGDDSSVFLHAAQNGFLYWFTNNRVHKFDGTITGGGAGTFTSDVLNFPSYMKCIDAVDYNSLFFIAIESSDVTEPENRTFPANTIGVYSWDFQSILASIRNFLPCPGARNIKKIFLNSDGDMRLITIGEDGFTEIRALSSGKFVTLFKLGRNAYPVRKDSLTYLNGMSIWLGADGYIYSLGKVWEGGKEQIYKIGVNQNSVVYNTIAFSQVVAGGSPLLITPVANDTILLFALRVQIDGAVDVYVNGVVPELLTSYGVANGNVYIYYVPNPVGLQTITVNAHNGLLVDMLAATYTNVDTASFPDNTTFNQNASELVDTLTTTLSSISDKCAFVSFSSSDYFHYINGSITAGAASRRVGTPIALIDVIGPKHPAGSQSLEVNSTGVMAEPLRTQLISMKPTVYSQQMGGIMLIGNEDSTQMRQGVLVTTTTPSVLRWYPHGVGTISTVAQINHVGDVYTLVLEMPTLVKINYIRFFHAPVGTSGTTVKGTIATYLNQSTTPSRTDDVTQSDVLKGYKYIKLGQSLLSGVFAIQFKLSWQTSTAASTTADWMPRFVEINYDPIDKLL